MWLCCVMCNIIASTWIRIQFYTVHLFFLKALRAKLHKNEFDCDKFQFSKGAPHQETEVMCPKSMQIMYPSGLTWPSNIRSSAGMSATGLAELSPSGWRPT